MSSILNFWNKPTASVSNPEAEASDWAGNDKELAILLAEAAASGKAITEDVVVDCQLTQFPAYGSAATATTHQTDEDEEEITKPESSNSWLNWMNTNAIMPTGSPTKEQQAPPKAVEKNLIEWDDEEQYLWKKRPKVNKKKTPKKTMQFRQPLLESRGSPSKVLMDRQYWMPDQLCKVCYKCEVPFTVFRRRHHCRICGQVFCNNCSAYFLKLQVTVRVCETCYKQEPARETPNNNNPNFKQLPQLNHPRKRAMHDPELPEEKPEVRGNNKAAEVKPEPKPPPPPRPDFLNNGDAHLGKIAADHLELMTNRLLQLHAPLLQNPKKWVHRLLTLATKCCVTVHPNVKKGDLMDIRPYIKVKTIPGGRIRDCAYLSGIVFRKTVSHKRMAKEINNPSIMLLAGGVEFLRLEHRITSLETLFEQEDTYTELLVSKILKLKPDVLIVGKSVSRRAQELLLKAGVVLIQQVKVALLNRIARQTGAAVIANTDHVMNQNGLNILGKCRRFRLVTFRDNEIWTDQSSPSTSNKQRSIRDMLKDRTIKHHERQAALAAKRLGEGVLDGSEAVKTGLASRGVARTYVMLEGCPKDRGCTVVLRGANRDALKQVKAVFRFLSIAAYNLRLETKYLRERGARLDPKFKVLPKHADSTSLCVYYGEMEEGRWVKPWNGGNATESMARRKPNELSAVDHQAILITSVWMTGKTQCCPAEVKGICYYSLQDVSLGQFLRDSCFNLSLKCQNPNCKKSVLDHSLSFVHNDGLLNITVDELEEELESDSKQDGDGEASVDVVEEVFDKPIATWTACKSCKKVVTPLTYISEDTWKFSFGKFLEVFFYNRDAILNSPSKGCSCNLQSCATLYFGCGKLAARFLYEPVAPFGVFVRKRLPLDLDFHRQGAMKQLDLIGIEAGRLFISFDKHIHRIAREARNLFNTPNNRPEHLQTVFSELNHIASEVDDASHSLQEKIASVTESLRRNSDAKINEVLLRFPSFARRYLFILATAWNEKLVAAGQAMSAMKKIAASNSQLNDGAIVNTGVPDPLNEELAEGMKRLGQLIEHYARYNVTDITDVLPSFPGGGDIQQETQDFDAEFDDPDASVDFSDDVDADVLASRRRLKSDKNSDSIENPTKSLGTRRSVPDRAHHVRESSLTTSAPPKPTPGGAVKSAITRFFNRGGRDYDLFKVNVGSFSEGRPRLPPGVDGIIVPVFDEQLSSIIAYSLASGEYAKQFRHFVRNESINVSLDGSAQRLEKSRKEELLPKPDLDAGVPPDFSARERQQINLPPSTSANPKEYKGAERRMLNRNKSHIKHTFRDIDEKGQVTCKYVCTTYWATQFHSVRQSFLSSSDADSEKYDTATPTSHEFEQSYIESLSSAYSWAAKGGKSGASFARTSDDRFVIKCISRTELQMFLDCAPAYFEYLSKAFFHGLPTVLCKIVGVYQIGVHNRETGKRSMEQVAVMQNIFYQKKITKIFDLKGSLRGRFTAQKNDETSDSLPNDKTDYDDDERRSRSPVDVENEKSKSESGPSTLLDGDFLDFTQGRPMPLTDRAKAVFQMSILNDTLFLSIINVLDYSILVGVDEENMELVVGIIDFMRQYDILKQMERVGKSLPMVVGSEAPTIIQPPLYKVRFTNAMERYFMTVPSKWTTI